MKKYNYFDDYDSQTEKKKKIDFSSLFGKFNTAVKTAEHKIDDFATSSIGDLSQSKKRLVTVICALVSLLIIVIVILSFGIQIHSENKNSRKFNANAAKVCAQYSGDYGSCSYESLVSKYKVKGSRMTGFCFARQMDFDNDGVSELLLSYNDSGVYYTEVWGFDDDGEFIPMYHGKAAQTDEVNDGAWITVYHHNNKYYIGDHNSTDIKKVTLLGLKDNQFTKKYDCTYDTESQIFAVNGKENEKDFERIKFSVLQHIEAEHGVELLTQTINEFGSLSPEDINSSQTDTAKRNRAYYSIIQDYNEKYGCAQYDFKNNVASLSGLGVVKLIDFDGDGTQELLLIYKRNIRQRDEDKDGNYIAKKVGKYFCDIYTWNGEKASLIYENEGLSNKLNNKNDIYFITKYQNDKYYICSNTFNKENYGSHITATSKITKYNGKEFKTTFKASYETQWGYTRYYVDGNSVYKNTFENEAYKVPFFDGTNNYDESVFNVIYVSKKGLGSAEIEKQLENTIATIKKTNGNYVPDEHQ